MAAAAHSERNWGPPRNSRNIPEGRWCARKAARWVGRRSPAKPANGVAPDSEPPVAPARSSSASRCEPFLEFIDLSLSKGRNAKGIWQNLVDNHGFTGGYSSVKRFVRRLRGSANTAEPMAPIDLLSCLVSDELTRRADRLLQRRRKQARST